MNKTRELGRRLELPRALWAALVLLAPPRAFASESIYAGETVKTRAEYEGRVTAAEHPFTFLVDPSTPSAGVFEAGYAIGLGSGVSADRPIPVVLQNQGVSNAFSLGYGVTGWLEPVVNLDVTVNTTTQQTTLNGFAGAKFQLTHPDSPWRAAVLAGGLREGWSNAWGAWMRASGSFSTGPFLAEANAYVEHVFAPGRDAVDYMGMLGVSYRVVPFLRVGAEYVGQDLEGLVDPEAEGGARMGLGPDLALDIDHGRFQVVVAALFGLNAISPTAVVRAGLVGSF